MTKRASNLTRRRFLASGAVGVASITALVALSACRKRQFSCNSTNGLSPEDVDVRKRLFYSDTSSDPQKTCASCQHYVPAPAGECGGCKLIKGPIHPQGYCKSYVPQI